MRGGPFPLLVEVAKLVEADLDRKISVRSRMRLLPVDREGGRKGSPDLILSERGKSQGKKLSRFQV